MALADGRWSSDSSANDGLGIALGTSGSDLQARDIARALANDPGGHCVTDIPLFAERMMAGLNPLWLLISLPNMISAHVAIQMEARGPNTTVMSDWSAGNQAIGEAGEWIRGGEADAVLAGGADCGVQPFAYQAYEQAGWLKTSTAIGFVPAEGAAVFLLEERQAALRRGARVLVELVAYATRAPHASRTAEQTLAQSLCDAMTAAGWSHRDVSVCHIAAPAAPDFADVAREALRMSLTDTPARATCDDRLGYALAAAGPIDAALALRTAPAGARVLSSAIGSSHQAVTLAFEVCAS
jgi:3-oxoacyl-(acyl-carrier-protein) synthase